MAGARRKQEKEKLGSKEILSMRERESIKIYILFQLVLMAGRYRKGKKWRKMDGGWKK